MNAETTNSLIDFDFDPFTPTTNNVKVAQQTNLVSSADLGGFPNDFSDAFDGDDWQAAMQNIGAVKDSSSKSFEMNRGGFDDMDWKSEIIPSTTIDESLNNFGGNENSGHFDVVENEDDGEDEDVLNARTSKFTEAVIKSKGPVSADDDQFMDLEFVESKPRQEKGLAGLKMYDHKIDDEFSSKSPRQQKKESSAAEKVSQMVFNYGSAMENVCKQCNKRVYEMEKITVDMVIYHKSCFRCITCGRLLSPSTYSATDKQIYCKADFMKNFKMKGSYVFSPELNPTRNEADIDSSAIEEDGTPVVPIKYMKDLFEKSDAVRSDDARRQVQERSDCVDGSNRSDVVLSSNVCVIEEELPPPSLAQNMRAMFENKESSSAKVTGVANKVTKSDEKQNAVQKNEKKPKNEAGGGSFATFSESVSVEGADDDEIPQEGMTKNLLARWRGIEDTTQTNAISRGRDENRSSGAMRRSQSSTRVEISQRLKVMSDDKTQADRNVSKEDGHQFESQRLQNTPAPASKTFKWQVKEATPLNRPCIVHGDLPKYQSTVGEVINEKTPISEINVEQYHQARSATPEELDEAEEASGESPARGSYVTEIREEELPDSAAVKSAMLRFKAMEDPTRSPPVPGKVAPTAANRLSYYGTAPAYPPQGGDDEDGDDGMQEELPASGTTRNMMAKFQSFQSK